MRVLPQPESNPKPDVAENSLPRLFEAQVTQRGTAVAVEDGTRRLTYSELNVRANRLARHLRTLGLAPGASIGLCMESSLEFVVGTLGILKAAHSYLPIDPANPPERLEGMLADAQTSVVLTKGAFPHPLPAGVRVFDLSTLPLEAVEGSNLDLPVPVEAIAYVMFTSGSTGRPKGAEIRHLGIARLVIETNYVEFAPSDVVALASNTAFDACTFELWGALLNGARLAVIDRATLLSPYRLTEVLREKGVTILFLTTPLFHLIARAITTAFGGLRYLVVGGDVLDPSAARLVLESAAPPSHLVNGYGPTETTTFAIAHRVKEVPADLQRIPIGTPIAHAQAHLLDEQRQPVAPGSPGELYLGGPGLARGYIAAPEMTAERFFETSFGRLYRTGDLAQMLPDGTIDFLGRVDQQIKFRGYRIELSEIESAIRRVARVGECRVIPRETPLGERQLIAYVTRNGTRIHTSGVLRAEVSRLVPEYMVPAAFIEVPEFPLTSNGKIDVAQLPLAEAAENADEAGALAQSQNTLHSQLIEIWEEILDRRPIGIRDDFFEIGGHSLIAIRMISLVEQRLGVRPALATLFEKATIEHLAASMLTELQAEARQQPFVALNTEGTKTPFFFLHGDFVGGGFFARGLADEMGEDRPFYAIHPHGLQGDLPPQSISVMASDRLATIRALQPHGPYLLGGYCNGALVAFEIARLLEAAGEKVPAVVLLMATGTNYRNRHLQRVTNAVGRLLGEQAEQRDQRFLTWNRRAGFALASLRHHLHSARELLHKSGSESFRRFRGKITRLFGRALHRPASAAPTAPPSEEQRFWDLYHDASESYVPGWFGGKLILLWPTDEPVQGGLSPSEGWDSVSPDVTLISVPGTHDTSITHRPNLQVVGEQTRHALEALETPSPITAPPPPAQP